MKQEWRKNEKQIYMPGQKPELIDIPSFNFITVQGEGRPGSEYFSDCIAALYTLSYGIKMTLKKLDQKPDGYCDYTVYPLEGIWDLNEEGRKKYKGQIDKDDLVYTLMIRQPDFVSEEIFTEVRRLSIRKKALPLLDAVNFQTICDGLSLQMLHTGSFDDEASSFKIMEQFMQDRGILRKSRVHREIYLSDFRKVPAERLKTVLRFQVLNT